MTISSSENVIDKNKIRREKAKSREELRDKGTLIEPSSIYFDGKKDVTLVNEKRGDKFYKSRLNEEHISIVSEPNSVYVGHVTPDSGSSQNIYLAISRFCETQSISLNSVVAIGCDGTNVNTGTNGGIIKIFEESLERPLHWFICMLHSNELLLRHLFSALDRKTSGPNSYTGAIGKNLKICEFMPIINFTPIPSSLQEIDTSIIKNLSTDQKYLYEIHQAVSMGEVSPDLSVRSPGGLNHANRILRLYVSTKSP